MMQKFQPGQPVKIKPGTTHNPQHLSGGRPRAATIEREMAGGEFVVVRIQRTATSGTDWVRVRAEDLEVAS